MKKRSSKYKYLSFSEKIRFFLQEKAQKINSAFSYVFIIYFLLNFSLFYLQGIEFIAPITSSSIFIYGIKVLSFLIFVGYALLFYIANKIKLSSKTFIFGAFLLADLIITLVLLPKTIESIEINQFGNRMKTTIHFGVFDILVSTLSSLIDFVAFFSFIFCFRQKIRRKDLIPFLIFIIGFTCAELLYSFVFDFKDYLSTFRYLIGKEERLSEHIHGTFDTKNGLGFLIFQGVIASFAMYFFKKRKPYLIFAFAFQIVSILVFCKTLLLSCIILDAILFVFYEIKLFKEKKKLSYWLLFPVVIVSLIFGLSFVPVLQGIQPFKLFNSTFKSIFMSNNSKFFSGREAIWELGLGVVKGPFSVFGYGRGQVADILNLASGLRTRTYHNAFLDLTAMFGIVGLCIYLIFVVYAFKGSIFIEKSAFSKFLVGVLVASLAYGFVENAILFMTSACPLITCTLLLSVSPEHKALVGTEGYQGIKNVKPLLQNISKTFKKYPKKIKFFIILNVFFSLVMPFIFNMVSYRNTEILTKSFFIVIGIIYAVNLVTTFCCSFFGIQYRHLGSLLIYLYFVFLMIVSLFFGFINIGSIPYKLYEENFFIKSIIFIVYSLNLVSFGLIIGDKEKCVYSNI